MGALGGGECDKVGEASAHVFRVLFRGKHLNDAPPSLRLPCEMRRARSAAKSAQPDASARARNKSNVFSGKNANLAQG